MARSGRGDRECGQDDGDGQHRPADGAGHFRGPLRPGSERHRDEADGDPAERELLAIVQLGAQHERGQHRGDPEAGRTPGLDDEQWQRPDGDDGQQEPRGYQQEPDQVPRVAGQPADQSGQVGPPGPGDGCRLEDGGCAVAERRPSHGQNCQQHLVPLSGVSRRVAGTHGPVPTVPGPARLRVRLYSFPLPT